MTDCLVEAEQQEIYILHYFLQIHLKAWGNIVRLWGTAPHKKRKGDLLAKMENRQNFYVINIFRSIQQVPT